MTNSSDNRHADVTRPPIVRAKPVRWFSPSELVSAGFQAGISATFGQYADKRELEATFAESNHCLCDAPHHLEAEHAGTPHQDPSELWIDFVSDTGDGFAATYAVAHTLSSPELEVDGDGDKALPRGRALFHGGDLVYPTASIANYQQRMKLLYRAAMPEAEGRMPAFFAIPGNHDWYDGLTSFIRIFVDGYRMGGRRLPQTRSYYSVRLSPDWWVWGIDIQLDTYIDSRQIEFFRRAAKEIPKGAGIILATAKPSWTKPPVEQRDAARLHEGNRVVRPSPEINNLDYLIRKCVKGSVDVRMVLAGDLHHYSRYSDEEDAQYVTAGGGGAYLSGTHHLPEKNDLVRWFPHDDRSLERQAVYPSQEWSRRRRWGALALGWFNPSFAALTGVIYLLLGWLALGSLQNASRFSEKLLELSDEGLVDSIKSIGEAAFSSSGDFLIVLAFLAILTLFGRNGRGKMGTAGGFVHGLAHMVALAVSLLVVSWLAPGESLWRATAIYVVGLVLLGAVLGTAVFGAYLTITDFWGLHTNEVFAAQRIEHRKNFLRMQVVGDTINCWAVGIDHIPPAEAWEVSQEASPLDPDFELNPFLLKKPFNPRVIDHFSVTAKRPPSGQNV